MEKALLKVGIEDYTKPTTMVCRNLKYKLGIIAIKM